MLAAYTQLPDAEAEDQPAEHSESERERVLLYLRSVGGWQGRLFRRGARGEPPAQPLGTPLLPVGERRGRSGHGYSRYRDGAGYR